MNVVCLFLKNGGDGINGVAVFKFLGEGIINRFLDRIDFRLVFVKFRSPGEQR